MIVFRHVLTTSSSGSALPTCLIAFHKHICSWQIKFQNRRFYWWLHYRQVGINTTFFCELHIQLHIYLSCSDWYQDKYSLHRQCVFSTFSISCDCSMEQQWPNQSSSYKIIADWLIPMMICPIFLKQNHMLTVCVGNCKLKSIKMFNNHKFNRWKENILQTVL